MKKLLSLLLCLLAVIVAEAGPISEQEAYQIAQQFMQGKFETALPNAQKQRKVLRSKRVAAAQQNLYIFNAEAGGGFVIVSGDDRTPAILGYSDCGEIDMENLPCNVKWLLDSYDSAIASLDDSSDAAAVAKASSSRTAIEPLLDTQWGQGSPYNSLCPTIDGEQCVTGCVATAMAQVINYHRWPQGETATVPSYTTTSNSISMSELPATTFDWNNMSSTAIARLMLYCGQSVSMDYGTGGSAAAVADVASALTDMFGYSKSISYKTRTSSSSDDWDEMLYDELSAGRAVLFGGQSSTGGHAFVVDGCDSDNKYHINWGWSGFCDGYFTLDGLDPTGSGGYNSGQEIVYNIAPPADAGDITRPKAVVTKMTRSSSYLERSSASDDFASLTVGSTLQSDMSETATIQVGLALYNDDGLVEVLSSGSHKFTTTESYTYEASVTIGSDIAQGEYRIVAINRSSDSDDWLADAGSSDVYISVTVGEIGLMLQVISNSGGSSTIDYGLHTIDGVTYQLNYISNALVSYRATVMPLHGTDKYSGDVSVPSKVQYQNIEFQVIGYNKDTNSDYPFEDSPELISLSISTKYAPPITNCPKLAKLELCEGVYKAYKIDNCSSLENLIYPETCYDVTFPLWCDNLKSITFKNKRNLELYCPYTSIWDPSLTDIYFASNNPPTLTDDAPTVKTNINIHIPKGSLESYNNSVWKDWNLIEDQPAIDQNGLYWDYCGESTSTNSSSQLFGYGDNNTELAMRMPAEEMALYKGCKISAIEFFSNALEGAFLFEYVFVTTTGKDYIVKQDAGTEYGGWTRIELEEPYTITGEELFVGIGRKGGLFIFPANDDYVEDGVWLRYMGDDSSNSYLGTWIKNAGYDYCVPIPLRAIIEGENIPTDVLVTSAGITEDSKQIKIKVINRSLKKISNIAFNWDLDGNKQGQQSVDTYIAVNGENYVYVDVPAITSGRRNHTMTISVASIDGEADAIPSNSSVVVNFATEASHYFPRKIVSEDATATWCGWCPREFVSIEKYYEKYPDNFIAIGVHNDAMMPASESYKAFFEQVTGYPTSFVNRTEWDSSAGKIIEETKDSAVVAITATAVFSTDVANTIKVNTEATFGFSDDGSTEYRIAYVLVEDSVGPYYQSNYYSGETYSDEGLNWWGNQGSKVEILFNDVARKIYDDYYGVEGSLPSVITEGETYKSEYTMTLPDNVQDAKNLKVVALLLDMSTGEILNADRTSISGEDPSGIAAVSGGSSGTFDVYNLMGMKIRLGASSLKGLPQGVYIVNGRKVAVR